MPTGISDLSSPALSFGLAAATVAPCLSVLRMLMTQNWTKLEVHMHFTGESECSHVRLLFHEIS